MCIEQTPRSGGAGVSSSVQSSTTNVSGATPAAKVPTLAEQKAVVMQSSCGHAHDQDESVERMTLGRRALHGGEPTRAPLRTPPSYFRSYEQVKAAMQKLAADKPDFVKLEDIGDSFEKTAGKADRDLLLMRLTSPKPGPKSKVFFFGGQHAREIANPELLMRFANWLLDNYGKDPMATMILDTREIQLMPIMNPDGHAVVERGYTGEAGGNLSKRKNTSGNNSEGTDLNRNWATKNWGTAGTSKSPTSETYSGPSAASEPETKALQAFIEKDRPNFVIDWHSYSELVLYPPDDSRGRTTPDQEHFVRVGKKMASFNGYTPQASVELYPTSGTSMWAYEKFGIPTFCIETGTAFHQTDAQYEETWKRNFPVMTWVAQIANDWKKASMGPEVYSARVDASGKLQAQAFDGATKQPAKAAEVVFDVHTPAGEGTAIPVGADGSLTMQTRQLAPGSEKKLMYVRAQDADGNWGPLAPLWQSERALRANLLAVRASQQRGQQQA